VCVSAGTNAFRDTDAENDDVVDGNDIKAGPDMTCDTTAESVDYLSTDIASDAVLQEWMNEKVYNQSVIEWTLSRQPAITVNFDLDRDYQVGVMTWMTPEMAAIRDAAVAAGVTGFDHVIFFVDDPDDGSGGFSEFNQIYAFVHVDSITEAGVSGVPEQVCSHELGHAQGLMHQMPDATNVMQNFFNDGAGKFRLRKSQWDSLNP
jgi:hypothetical protein